MAPTNTRLENQILHFSKRKKWDKVENLWTQLLEEPSNSPKFYATLAKNMVREEKTEDLRSWAMLLIEACESLEEHRALIQAARGILLALPDFDDIRAPLIAALRKQYAKNPRTDEYLDASGLQREENLQKPLKLFLQFIKCSEGEVFQHAEWGEAAVLSMDIDTRRVSFNFSKGGEKSFSFAGVNDYLKKISKKHLFAQRVLNPERLVERAKENPVDFIKYCLKCLGGKASRAELKENLTVGVFDSRTWNSWWTKSRDRLRFDPYIAFSGTAANAVLKLRTQPKSFHKEILGDFLKAETFAKEYALVNDLLKLVSVEAVPEDISAKLLQGLEKKYKATRPNDYSTRLEYHYLYQDLKNTLEITHDVFEAVPLDTLLSADNHPVDIICNLTVSENQMRAAKHLKAAHPDRWAEYAEDILLTGPMRLGQWALKDLIENNNLEAASHLAEQLLHRPDENPNLFLWLVRALRDGKLPELQIEITPETLFDVTMEMIEDSHKRVGLDDPDSTSLKNAINRFQNLLMDNHYAIVTDVFEAYDPAQAHERYETLMASNALAEKFKISLDQILRSLRRDLDESLTDSDATQAEHYVTAQSFKSRQAEYMEIKNKLIPENSKAIGKAAAMGDLSENAEYHSAKAEQKILFRRVEALEDLLQRARVLEPENISTDTIGFGTNFQIKNLDSGEIEAYTLLGIWDAQPEKNILSYLTPFGKQFLKRKAADTLVVVRPGGGSTQYKVLEITNALTQ